MFCYNYDRYIQYADHVTIDVTYTVHHLECGSDTFPDEEFVDVGAYAIIDHQYLA